MGSFSSVVDRKMKTQPLLLRLGIFEGRKRIGVQRHCNKWSRFILNAYSGQLIGSMSFTGVPENADHRESEYYKGEKVQHRLTGWILVALWVARIGFMGLGLWHLDYPHQI